MAGGGGGGLESRVGGRGGLGRNGLWNGRPCVGAEGGVGG